jgi:high-affinity iron transporter
MAKNLFSVPIFFIVFRETLEAAIIISVLLGLAEQIVHEDPAQGDTTNHIVSSSNDKDSSEGAETAPANDLTQRRRLIRKLRLQVVSFMGIFHFRNF